MSTTVVGDLILRAGMDLSGLDRGIQQMQQMVQRGAEQAQQLGVPINVVPPNVQQQGQRAAQEMARGFEAGRQRLSDAVSTSFTEAAQQSAQAAQQSAAAIAPAAAAVDAVGEANRRATEAVRERVQAEREAAAAVTTSGGGVDAVRQEAEERRRIARETRISQAEAARLDEQYRQQRVQQERAAAQQSVQVERERVRAQMQAAETLYRDSIGRIKEAQIQGLLTAAEARQAGTDAAREYNEAMIQTLNRGRTTPGVFQGQQGARLYGDVANSLRDVDSNARRAHGGLGRLNNALVTVFQRTANTNTVVGQAVDVIGTFALGTGVMVGVLAGMAALAAAWSRITKESREAKRETEDALESLRKLAEERALPSGGRVQVQTETASAEVERQRAEIDRLTRLRDVAELAGRMDDDQLQMATVYTRQIEAARRALARAEEGVRTGGAELVRARVENTERLRAAEASNLAVIVASGRATSDEIRRINSRIAEEEQRVATIRAAIADRLRETGMGPSENQQADLAASISTIEALRGAQERLGDASTRAAEDAARALQEQIGHLADARRLGVLRREDIAAALELERSLSAAMRAGNGTLEDRVRIAEQVTQLAGFSLDRTPDVAVQRSSVFVAGVEIENPEEIARMYAEQARDVVERQRVEAQMVLAPIRVAETDDQRARRESERRRAAVQAAQEATEAYNESIQAGLSVIGAFGDLADAAEILSDGFGDALRAIETMAEGAMRVRFGNELGGTLGALAQVSGYLTIAAGAVQMIDGLFGESEEQRQYNAAVRDATDALATFRRELSGFRPDTAEVRGSTLGAVEAAQMANIGDPGFMRLFSPDRQRRMVEDFFRSFGLTLDEVLAVAESRNVQLFDDAGRFVPDNLVLFADSLELARQAMVGFRDSILSERQQERSLQDRILGIDRTPAQQQAALFGDVAAIAPDLFREFLSGVDLTDVEAGRQALYRMLAGFSEGGEAFAALMGGFTREEFLDWIGQAADGFARMAEATESVTGALLNVPQGFRILNVELARFNAAQRARADDLQRPTTPPPAATPPTEPERPQAPGTRPPEEGGSGPGRERPVYQITDNRTYTIPVTQRPDEDAESFARRIEEIVRRMEREDAMVYGDSYARR